MDTLSIWICGRVHAKAWRFFEGDAITAVEFDTLIFGPIPHDHTSRESSKRDYCECQARSVMIFMAWDLSLGLVWRPDILRVIWSENGRFEYFGKELHVYFIFPFVRPQDTNTNVVGVKKTDRHFPILDESI